MPDLPFVTALHRYPLKSVLGEPVGRLAVDRRGVTGDRLWSVRTAGDKIGSGKDTRRFAAVPGLLGLRARTDDEGRVVVTFPDGRTCATDSADAAAMVSRHVGQQVTLATESGVSHFDDGPVSLLGLASVAAVAEQRDAAVDPARFRANVLLSGTAAFAEDGWVGARLTIGTVVLHVSARSPRCVMVDMATADLPAQPGNLLAVGRLNDADLGVVATVLEPGSIRVGDTVTAG